MGRFLTDKDMKIMRWEESRRASLRKRGELPAYAHTAIVVCGCGAPGCSFERNCAKWLDPKEPPKPPTPQKK